jgi:hypothetical protein
MATRADLENTISAVCVRLSDSELRLVFSVNTVLVIYFATTSIFLLYDSLIMIPGWGKGFFL